MPLGSLLVNLLLRNFAKQPTLADIAHQVEQHIRNVQVTGSTPVVGSSTSGTLQALLNLRE